MTTVTQATQVRWWCTCALPPIAHCQPTRRRLNVFLCFDCVHAVHLYVTSWFKILEVWPAPVITPIIAPNNNPSWLSSTASPTVPPALRKCLRSLSTRISSQMWNFLSMTTLSRFSSITLPRCLTQFSSEPAINSWRRKWFFETCFEQNTHVFSFFKGLYQVVESMKKIGRNWRTWRQRDPLSNEGPFQLNLENHEGYSDTILTHLSSLDVQALSPKLHRIAQLVAVTRRLFDFCCNCIILTLFHIEFE